MQRTWHTDEVVRCLLEEADMVEVRELIEEEGDEAPEALREWIREGNGPKALSDAIMRFTRAPDESFNPINWDEVVERILQAV